MFSKAQAELPADAIFADLLSRLEHDNDGAFSPEVRIAIENAFHGGMLSAIADMVSADSLVDFMQRRLPEIEEYQKRLDARS